MATNRVDYLNTEDFNDTIVAYESYIKKFEAIVKEVNSAAGKMVERWKGKGCSAFEKDYKQVQLNLKDISDIMYDLRDALINAHSEYMKTDEELSKSFES